MKGREKLRGKKFIPHFMKYVNIFIMIIMNYTYIHTYIHIHIYVYICIYVCIYIHFLSASGSTIDYRLDCLDLFIFWLTLEQIRHYLITMESVLSTMQLKSAVCEFQG